jgi:hypothetical protein
VPAFFHKMCKIKLLFMTILFNYVLIKLVNHQKFVDPGRKTRGWLVKVSRGEVSRSVNGL